MRLLLIFLLLTPLSFSQIEHLSEAKNEYIDSLILGDWYLNQVDVVDGSNEYSDSNRFTSAVQRSKKISFTVDSIINYRDKSLRYYTRLQHYAYRIEYDSLMERDYLKLYAGKKRKQREVEFYEILHCSDNELIIKSFQYVTYGIDAITLSIIYVYRREEVSELAGKLKVNGWHYCSDKDILLFSDEDTLEYVFTQTVEEFECDEWSNQIYLSFDAIDYRNMLGSAESSGVIGSVSRPISYSLDSRNNLLFVHYVEPFVFNISILGDKLILSLNKEKTNEERLD